MALNDDVLDVMRHLKIALERQQHFNLLECHDQRIDHQSLQEQFLELLDQLWTNRSCYMNDVLGVVQIFIDTIVSFGRNSYCSSWWIYPTLCRCREFLVDGLLNQYHVDRHRSDYLLQQLAIAITTFNRWIACNPKNHSSTIITPLYCIVMELTLIKDLILNNKSQVHANLVIHLCRVHKKYQDLLELKNDQFFMIEYLKVLSSPEEVLLKRCYVALGALGKIIRSDSCTCSMKEVAYFGCESHRVYCCKDYLGFRDVFFAYVQKASRSRCLDTNIQKWLDECRLIVISEHVSLKIKEDIRSVLYDRQQRYILPICDYLDRTGLQIDAILSKTPVSDDEIRKAHIITDDVLIRFVAFPTSPIVSLPYINETTFVGRDSLLREIRNRFDSNMWKTRNLSQVVLTGISGSGKSTAAIYYALQHKTKYQLVYLLNAETEIALQNSYLKLAYDICNCAACEGYTTCREIIRLEELLEDYSRSLTIFDNIIIDTIVGISHTSNEQSTMEKIVVAVLDIIYTHFHFFLLFDNATDYLVLDKYVPVGGHGDVIVTTLDLQWPNAVFVSLFDRDSSLDCIRLATNQHDCMFANRIAELADDLPLAIHLITAYLNVNQITLKQFVESIEVEINSSMDGKRDHNVNGQNHIDEPNMNAVEVHPFMITLINLVLKSVSGYHVIINNMLHFMAYSSSELMSATLLENFINSQSDIPELLQKPLEILVDYALLEEQMGDFKMHRLVKHTLRRLFNSSETKDSRIMTFYNDQVDLGYLDSICWKRWKIIASHIEVGFFNTVNPKLHKLDIYSSLLCKLGKIYFLNGVYDKAESLLKKAMQIYTQSFDANSLDMASFQGYIGLVFCAQGKYEDAENHLKISLSTLDELEEDNSVDIAAVYNRLAMVNFACKHFRKADDYSTKATDIVVKHAGDESIDYAVCCHNFGCIYKETYRFDDALKMYKKALKTFQKCDKKVGVWTAICYGYIGEVLKDIGKYEEAILYYESAIDDGIPLLGLHSLEIADFHNNIGILLRHQGRYEEALDHHWKALQSDIITSKETSLPVARTYRHIGNVYYALGKYKIALFHFKRSLSILNKLSKHQSVDCADVYSSLGNVNRALGKYANALCQYQTSISIYKSICGENSLKTACGYNSLGLIAYSRKNFDDALFNLRQALDIRCKLIGERSLEVSTCYTNIGFVHLSKQNFQDALEYFTKSLSLTTDIRGKFSLDTTVMYDNIALAYKAQNLYESAAEYYEKSLQIRKKLFGLFHVTVARSYYDLGRLYQKCNEMVKAREYLEGGRHICSQCISKNQHLTNKITKALQSLR